MLDHSLAFVLTQLAECHNYISMCRKATIHIATGITTGITTGIII